MGKSSKSKKHKLKKSKKEKRRERRGSTSSSSSNSAEEWIEKETEPAEDLKKSTESKRDEWLSLPTNFMSTSNLDRRKDREEKKQIDKLTSTYNPRENVRELNPYWKSGGDGLPTFKKPTDNYQTSSKTSSTSQGRWKKKSTVEIEVTAEPNLNKIAKENTHVSSTSDEILSDKELNVLASKLVKAEIMGNTVLIKELKEKLERARQIKSTSTDKSEENEEVILSRTDAKGFTKPLKQSHEEPSSSSSSSRKKQKVETHVGNDRVRYFADDDKYSLKQMFENEKYNSVEEQNAQFLKLAGKVRKNDDLDDVFADDIRKMDSDEKTDRRNRDKAISEHQRMRDSIDNCNKCIDSQRMAKHLVVTVGETVYLSLPEFEPLTEGHCIITPIRHVPCATQLDENEWAELMQFRKLLTKMFSSQDRDVVFFENAKNLSRHPHMYLECVPVDKETGDMAPIYFKKAIDESEREWSDNKKLVSLAGRDVRRAVPKGLPYFSVSFGMQEGYAHVIEDRQYFPDNFAQEIIGGMLDLHHSIWRKPKLEKFEKQSKRVLEFTNAWNSFEKSLSA